jgi:hypothetical protein
MMLVLPEDLQARVVAETAIPKKTGLVQRWGKKK